MAEDFSDESSYFEPQDWKTFLDIYRERMLEQEIEELGTGKN